MENNYQVIRLTNNTIIVGQAEFTPEDVIVANPLEVYSKPIQDKEGKVIGEHMVLRPLLIMTEERDIVLDTYNVLYANKLEPRLVTSYEEMVKTVYSKDVAYDGSAYVEKEEQYTKEEAEYMKEALDKFLGKDKIVH